MHAFGLFFRRASIRVFRDKRNYLSLNFEARTLVLTLHLPAGSSKSVCSVSRFGTKEGRAVVHLQVVSRTFYSFGFSFVRGYPNGVSTYSLSEVQIEYFVLQLRTAIIVEFQTPADICFSVASLEWINNEKIMLRFFDRRPHMTSIYENKI